MNTAANIFIGIKVLVGVTAGALGIASALTQNNTSMYFGIVAAHIAFMSGFPFLPTLYDLVFVPAGIAMLAGDIITFADNYQNGVPNSMFSTSVFSEPIMNQH